MIVWGQPGTDKQVDAEEEGDEQSWCVELKEMSVDVAKIHPVVYTSADCYTTDEQRIEP